MRQHLRPLLATLLVTASIAACGIPEEQHNEALNKIKQLKMEAAAADQACSAAKADLTAKNKTLGDENRALKTKLVSMGQNLNEIQTQAGQMVQDLSEKEQQIAHLMEAQKAARAQAEIFRNLLGQFKKMIDAGKINVKIRNGRMVVQMSDKVLFDSGKAQVKKSGQEALKEVARVLAGVGGRDFQVAGHTDNIPIKTHRFRSNWELSTARAVNVVKFLVENGMSGSHVSAAGYAEFDPIGDNATEEGRQLNRRIEITLVPSLAQLPAIGN